tara:strand:- start:1327 stop:1950 length:624 start_codon:yes stop_codon:yes gene_type:complete
MKIYNQDCLEAMKEMADKEFDLAIVDPPYAVEELTGKEFSHDRGILKNRAFSRGHKKIKKWDVSPKQDYFDELFRVSKNQIIWGGNYFNLPKYRCVIVWDKKQPFPNFSAVEIAWSSFNKPAKLFKFDNRYKGKIHPTQKPIQLYEWLLINFAKEGDKILDTHLGSGSIAIACHNLKYDLAGYEIDKEYFEVANKRIEQHKSQIRMF